MPPRLRSSQRPWSLPSTLAVTLILLSAICHKQAISISDSQPQARQQVGSESQATQSSTSLATASNAVAQTQAAKNSPPSNATTFPTTTELPTTTTTTTSSSSSSSSSTTVTNGRSVKVPPPSTPHGNSGTARTHNPGRLRKPTTPRHSNHHQPHQSLTSAVDSQTTSSWTTSAPAADQMPDHIKQIMEQYSNTPPLFVTTTRDFFVDVASFPSGFKLATMQAVDSEGDRLEYSLQPASYRDASPYFSINATSGELRLASKRLPEPAAGSEQEDEDEGETSAALESGGELAGQNSGNLYFLNVAANDGKYTSVVELQIHVFNSSSLTPKSSAALRMTPESGTRHIQAKTREFFDKLYGGGVGQHQQHSTNQRQDQVNNSTIVYPNFVNPTLMMLPIERKEPPSELEDSTRVVPTGRVYAGQSPHPSFLEAEQHQQHQQPQQLHHFDPNIQRPTQAELANSSNQNKQHAEQMIIMQQPMVLSFVVIFCSCLIVGFVLLVFIVPISVKRLKKRLKTMERQHEQLSAKASTGAGSSITSGSCMSHATGSSAGSMTTSTGGRHLPSSLSQCTLSSSDRSCATMMPAATMMMMAGGPNHHYLINNHHHPLGRQSSLDSALSVANGNCQNLEPVNQMPYYPSQQHNASSIRQASDEDQAISQLHHFQLQPNQMNPTNNGLNRINNGAIVNPVYLHQPGGAGGRLVNQQNNETTATENIYCPIDEEFYSTINTESTLLDAGQLASLHTNHNQINYNATHHVMPMMMIQTAQLNNNQVGSLVGQTCDSRNYLASGCAQPVAQRDTSSPTHSISSRSSTRSLARFLSLPARHWSHQQHANAHPKQASDLEDQKSSSSSSSSRFLDELRHLFEPKTVFNEEGAKTIARADRISQEHHRVRQKRPRTNETKSSDPAWEIERHKLKFLEILDEGQFGLVWRCKLKVADQSGQDGELTVAVKSLKSFAAKDARECDELLAEIEIMKLVCDHPNVVRILHSCTQDLGPNRPILLVMEYVELGNLQSYLKRSRAGHLYATTASCFGSSTGRRSPQFQQDYRAMSCVSTETDDNEGHTSCDTSGPQAPRQDLLTSRLLIKFIYHVAKGMEHLASQCIVHRDLASRNILVSGQDVCKIGDFGMARHMASQGDVYERHSRNTKVPVRWMAPEVLLENSFTTKSDVFSFGILMWEIVTLGSTPYRHLQTADIIGAVARHGERPERPEYCHELLYGIMSSCWSHEASKRPTFKELVQQLDSLLMSTEEYIELDQYSGHNYYNIPKTAAPLELL